MILVGAGFLTPGGLAGAALYVMGHGMVKAALFMCAGIFLQCEGTLDEQELRGCCTRAKLIGAIMLVAALGLAGFPPYGTYVGKALMEESSARFSQAWVPWVFAFASAFTAAAVLRVAGGAFLGWGSTTEHGADSTTAPERKETDKGCRMLPFVMIAMAALLAVLPAISAFVPRLTGWAQAAAARFTDTAGYEQAVLDSRTTGAIHPGAETGISAASVTVGTCTALAAIAIAFAALGCDRIPRRLRNAAINAVRPLITLHSGDVRDYIAWLVFGVSLLALLFHLSLR
jgi:multicomponent Na+:H+ antiporter subunit D